MKAVHDLPSKQCPRCTENHYLHLSFKFTEVPFEFLPAAAAAAALSSQTRLRKPGAQFALHYVHQIPAGHRTPFLGPLEFGLVSGRMSTLCVCVRYVLFTETIHVSEIFIT